tara:strand:- start:652 stop:1002 length:351 start_codon:yes stop_codon:yes gene_type:complete
MKTSTLSILLFAVAIGVGLFTVKHRVQDLESQLFNLNRQVAEDREALQVLRAEWSHLNEPKRLKILAHKYLGMTAVTLDKVISRNELIDKIPIRQEMSTNNLAEKSEATSRKDKVQ